MFGNRRSLRSRCALPSLRSRPIWNDPFCSERVTVHCQWGGKPQNCPFPLTFRHPFGGGPTHGHRQRAQKNIGKDRDLPLLCYYMLINIIRFVDTNMRLFCCMHVHLRLYSALFFSLYIV